MGLDGFEAYSSGQDDYPRQQLLSFARDNNMVISGGSDFHGTLIPAIDLGSGRGDLNIPDQVYWDLLNYWKEKNKK
jgi:hypothetical protein